MLSDLASFLTAILASWITLMGGIVAVVLYILARYRGRDVRGWTYAGIALFALFVSCFLAWRDEHGRVERRAHLAEVKDCPRWLNDARKTQLIDALRAVEPPASVEVAWVGGSGEAERYAEDFLQVLDTVGWKATTTQVATMAPVPSLGLDVRARPRDVPAGELVSTLDRLGVPVELISDPTRAEHEVKIRVGKKPE